MYGYGYGYYGFDWTYILLIIGMLLSLAASARLKSTFSCYRRIRSASGLTGAETAKRILQAAGITDVHVQFNAMYGKGRIGGQPVILMKPLSYMNLSGGPIREMANYFKIDPETEMIVIYDDIDLDPGQLRIRKKGSAGGHNGIKHIIQQLGTQNFVRIKVGVGAKPKGWDLADYVLGRFDKDDRALVEEAQERACKAVELILTDSVDAAMNEYNKKTGNV